MNKLIAFVLVAAGAFIGWGSWWYSAQAPIYVQVPPQPVSVMFVGDIMLDRAVATTADTMGAAVLLSGSEDLFTQTDLRVANLEGPITTNKSIAQVDHSILHFTFDPSLARTALSLLNISAVSLANNHTYDFGKAGYDSTRNYLAEWGVAAFGHPYNNAQYLSTKLEAHGKTICLIGYMQLYDPATSTVVAEIQSLRPSCDKEVVFAHWGVEYTHDPTSAQIAAAHAFIDAGADLVIGAHPHVIQPLEIYKGKAIVYSLGNFLFDQDFSWDTEHGMAVRVDFYPDKTRLIFIPLSVYTERTFIAEGSDRDLGLSQVGVGQDGTVTLPL